MDAACQSDQRMEPHFYLSICYSGFLEQAMDWLVVPDSNHCYQPLVISQSAHFSKTGLHRQLGQ